MKMNIFFTIFFSTMSILLADPPNWQDDPGAYQYVATIVTGIVLSDGVNMADDGDLFAAFDEAGNVRGVAGQLSASFGPYDGQTYYEMTMRSNAAGDLLSFKYYDASEDAILDVVETYEFVINDILGDVINPIFFNIGSGSPPCEDDDSLVAPFTCASAIASFGCDFVWGSVTIGEACPESCDLCDDGGDIEGCTDDTACNYNPFATIAGVCDYASFSYNQSLFQAGYFFSDVTIDGVPAVEGEDEIYAFNGSTCVGGRVWEGPNIEVVLMGSDGTGFTDGYLNGPNAGADYVWGTDDDYAGDIPTFKIVDKDTDKSIFESGAIMLYLVDKYKKLLPFKNIELLDIGCGDGTLMEYLKINQKNDVRGLEPQKNLVQQCIAKGLSVIEGDAEKELAQFPKKSFDYVVLSQTLQAFLSPEEVLKQLLRIGKQTIVSIPNFGYWKVRLHLLFKGTMPITKNLPNEWYNTPNLHMCTIQDFVNFCNKKDIKIDKSMCLTNEKISEITNRNMSYKNIFSQLGIFLIQ